MLLPVSILAARADLRRCSCAWEHTRVASVLLMTLLMVFLSTPTIRAQDDAQVTQEEARLIDQQPFDLITLTEDAGGESVKVAPLPFPNRVVPNNAKETDKLEVVVIDFPDRRYEVKWRAIKRIDLYEQMIYDETLKKVEDRDFGAAFQNLSYLLRNYPSMPRLENLRQEFLLRSAEERYRAGEYMQTLSALEELRETAPNYRGDVVLRVLSQVASSLIGSYEENNDLGSAKKLLNRLKSKYGPTLAVVVEWEGKLEKMALAKRHEALQLFEQKRYREARRAAVAMLNMFPDQVGKQLIGRIHAAHPMVRVGVMQRSATLDPSSLVNWPARRAGRLVYQPLFQFLETGSEGGRYGFALGTYRLSDDRQQLVLSVDKSVSNRINAFGLGQLLLDRAQTDSADYDPSWAAIFRSVEAGAGEQVIVNLQRPNVLPHALLQWKLTDGMNADSTPLAASYELTAIEDHEVVFSLRPGIERRGQPVEIIEIFYDNAQAAMNDLRQGELDILDQLYPADAEKLATNSQFKVGAYALPTTHMLVPVSDDPYLAKDKFRRALMYAFNREKTLSDELLNSRNTNDGRVISSPFPLGASESDPLAYAYDPSIAPMEFNQGLAKLLIVMTEQEMRAAAEKNKEPLPPRKKLVVGCPDFEFARVAVQAMIQQWAYIGLQAEMKILPPDQITTEGCDLVYLVTTMWEPATDIERLLGGNGIAATDNPFIVQALESLRRARNWREVKLAMQDLHRLIDYHLPVMPLWQITDRFAVSRYVEGLGDRPVSLYQDVESWRLNLDLQTTAQR